MPRGHAYARKRAVRLVAEPGADHASKVGNYAVGRVQAEGREDADGPQVGSSRLVVNGVARA